MSSKPELLSRADPAADFLPGKGRPLLMGILNVTPDSFYAASRCPAAEEALERALRFEAEGADILDIGGQSTRPGSLPVSEEEELRRVLPALEAVAGRVKIPLSIDTSRPGVARRALDAGAAVLNDVLALRGDPGMPAVAAGYRRVALMHMRGDSPRTMQADPRYRDVVGEISEFFKERLEAFARAGGDPARVWLDPGIGFGKTAEHNDEILRRLEEFRALGRPLLIGASRKSFLGSVPEERLEASLAVACRAAQARVFALRVHDVAQTRRALETWARVAAGGRA